MNHRKLKAPTIKHIKQAVKNMKAGYLIVRKADNAIMAYYSIEQWPIGIPMPEINLDEYMYYYKGVGSW